MTVSLILCHRVPFEQKPFLALSVTDGLPTSQALPDLALLETEGSAEGDAEPSQCARGPVLMAWYSWRTSRLVLRARVPLLQQAVVPGADVLWSC